MKWTKFAKNRNKVIHILLKEKRHVNNKYEVQVSQEEFYHLSKVIKMNRETAAEKSQ